MNRPEKYLSQRIQETHAFFEPDNLKNLLLKYNGEAVLLVIDVQKEFCDPKQGRGNQETVAVSERIQSIVPAFRKAGIPVYAIYYSRAGEKKPEDIDFFKFSPGREDMLFAKNTDSAFWSGKLKETLAQEKSKKLLLVCGFNQAACVKETVISARKEGYDVCLLVDLAGNDNFCKNFEPVMRKAMNTEGAVMATSGDVLKRLRAAAPKP